MVPSASVGGAAAGGFDPVGAQNEHLRFLEVAEDVERLLSSASGRFVHSIRGCVERIDSGMPIMGLVQGVAAGVGVVARHRKLVLLSNQPGVEPPQKIRVHLPVHRSCHTRSVVRVFSGAGESRQVCAAYRVFSTVGCRRKGVK